MSKKVEGGGYSVKFIFPLIGTVDALINGTAFFNFISRQLANYIDETKQIEGDYFNKCLSCELFAQEDKIMKKISEFFRNDFSLGRLIKVEGKSLSFMGTEYQLQKEKFCIKSRTNFVKKVLAFKKKSNIEKLQYADYHITFYNLLLFPIFSLYCLLDGYYLIHGSLLEYNKTVYLLTGLDGVGKSSISNIILSAGGKILADNFVLFNGKYAIPFNMAMRIDTTQITDMPILASYEEFKEVLPPKSHEGRIIPDKIIVLSIEGKDNVQKTSLTQLNMTTLSLYLNNAPEINAANNFITPFLYHSISKTKDLDIGGVILKVPMGKIESAIESLLNDC